MTWMPKLIVGGTLATSLLLSMAWAQQPKAPAGDSKAKAAANEVRPNAAAGPMKLKLKHVQKVLEGVALEDFDAIAKNAETLGLLAQDENWQVYQTLEYRQRSADFQRIANELAKSAKQKNIDRRR